MKERLKRVVGPEWQRRMHRLSRLRWLSKLRIVRTLTGDRSFRRRASYILWDPETDSYSYELADEHEMLAGLAAAGPLSQSRRPRRRAVPRRFHATELTAPNLEVEA